MLGILSCVGCDIHMCLSTLSVSCKHTAHKVNTATLLLYLHYDMLVDMNSAGTNIIYSYVSLFECPFVAFVPALRIYI